MQAPKPIVAGLVISVFAFILFKELASKLGFLFFLAIPLLPLLFAPLIAGIVIAVMRSKNKKPVPTSNLTKIVTAILIALFILMISGWFV